MDIILLQFRRRTPCRWVFVSAMVTVFVGSPAGPKPGSLPMIAENDMLRTPPIIVELLLAYNMCEIHESNPIVICSCPLLCFYSQLDQVSLFIRFVTRGGYRLVDRGDRARNIKRSTRTLLSLPPCSSWYPIAGLCILVKRGHCLRILLPHTIAPMTLMALPYLPRMYQ